MLRKFVSLVWSLFTPDVEPMGKNRAVKLVLAKAESENR